MIGLICIGTMVAALHPGATATALKGFNAKFFNIFIIIIKSDS